MKYFIYIFLLFTLNACDETILHNLNEFDANKVIVVLAKTGIAATKSARGTYWQVSVSSDNNTRALEVLEQSRVLKHEVKLNKDRASSLVLSKEEKAHFLERELAWNLERTLEQLPYVLEARVHLYFKQSNRLTLRTEKQAQSASVLLISDKAVEVDKSAIKKLVSGASGVSSSTISVLISNPGSQKTEDTRKVINPDSNKIAENIKNKRAEASSNVLVPVSDVLTKNRYKELLLFLVVLIMLGVVYKIFRTKGEPSSVLKPVDSKQKKTDETCHGDTEYMSQIRDTLVRNSEEAYEVNKLSLNGSGTNAGVF